VTGTWAARLLAERPRQPDQRSCGAAVLVVERAMRDEDYARWLVEDPSSSASRFRDEALGTHRRTTSAVTAAGRLQLPWPRALGTPPWAVANELSVVRGRSHVVRWALSRASLLEHVTAAVAGGATVPLYVGSRLLPRHVVLGLDAEADDLRCYEPNSGRVLTVSHTAFRDAGFRLAGWTTPWCAVVPG
jgi:hypothetical protein